MKVDELNSIFTEDIILEKDFLSILVSTSNLWKTYGSMVNFNHQKGAFMKKNSFLRNQMNDVEGHLASLALKLRGLGMENKKNVSGASAMSQKFQRKLAIMNDVIVACGRVNSKLALVTPKLQVRNCQMRTKVGVAKDDVQLHLLCDLSLQWEEATDNIILAGDSLQTDRLTCEDLLYVANIIKGTVGLNVRHVAKNLFLNHKVQFKVLKDIAFEIANNLPVMLFVKGHEFIVVDFHDFVYQSNSLSMMFEFDIPEAEEPASSEPEVEVAEVQIDQDTANSYPATSQKKKRAGRNRIADKFPTVVEVALKFIQEHSFSAHVKRRQDTASCGVSLGQIRHHLLDSIPGLKEHGMSKRSVHRLMEPPRKGTRAAAGYYSLINARVPKKQNNLVKEHSDIHYCRAAVKLFAEMFEEFSNETILLSADDMNKLNVGTLAVSRYHQIEKFFMKDDSPDYLDHDFPEGNAKLNPSGYMILQHPHDPGRKGRPRERVRAHRSSSQPPSGFDDSGSKTYRSQSCPPSPFHASESDDYMYFVKDKHGRLHYQMPRSGPHHMFVRAVRYHRSTSENHANDLHKVLTTHYPEKTVVGIIADGGPDWSVKSVHNIFQYGRLWKSLKLDFLGITQHAPGNSKENPIEHAWSPRSKDLTSVTLPRHVESDLDDPTEKDKLDFDNAIEVACSYWRGKTFNGFPVFPNTVKCSDQPHPFSDFDDMSKYFKTIKVTDESEYKEEMRFLIKHCTRKCHGLEFSKCEDPSCQHCSNNPPKALKFMGSLFRQGCHSYCPQPDPWFPGSYKTYIRMKGVKFDDSHLLDKECPSLTGTWSVCQKGCRYVFLSKADKERHDKLCHYEEMKRGRRKEQQKKRRDAASTSQKRKKSKKSD